MNKAKETFVIGFAIFAAFFGAGNLILPPFLGFQAGPDWWLVAFGFLISATIIPFMALFAHARLQGTMLDFGNKVSPLFSLVFCLCVYVIAISLPVPRTAAVTHEMAIQPFFDSSSLVTSCIYFTLVFLFAINRGKVIDLLGKYLTPLIGIILVIIICVGVFSSAEQVRASTFETPLLSGFFEGYQTYDAIAGLLTGGIIIISLNIKGYTSFENKKVIIARSGAIAMLGLLIIYIGLIFVGANYNLQFSSNPTRSELLFEITHLTLGRIGNSFLSILVALSCFTTAVCVIVGTADFFKGLFNQSQRVYILSLLITCFVGIFVGQMDVNYIINIALPALMFIYPLTIVLIFLNVIPQKWASKRVYKAVVLVTFLFSIPDFLGFLIKAGWLTYIKNIIPLANKNLTWLLPALAIFIIMNSLPKAKR